MTLRYSNEQHMTSSEMVEGLTSYWTERSTSYSEQNMEEMNNWKRDVWRNLILKYAPEKETLRVLDVGTGPGFFSMNLALAGHEVTAVDITEDMLAYARKNACAYGAKVNFTLYDGVHLPLEDNSIDLIVNRNVLWNMTEPEAVMAEWQRVLSPGGRMVYFDANWYLYLFDEKARQLKYMYEQEMALKHPEHNPSGSLSRQRVADLERIAWDLPLSSQVRPAWDKQVLTNLGMKIVFTQDCIDDIIYTDIEKEYYHLTPMFMVCAEK